MQFAAIVYCAHTLLEVDWHMTESRPQILAFQVVPCILDTTTGIFAPAKPLNAGTAVSAFPVTVPGTLSWAGHNAHLQPASYTHAQPELASHWNIPYLIICICQTKKPPKKRSPAPPLLPHLSLLCLTKIRGAQCRGQAPV